MSYAAPPRRSSAATVIIVILLLGFTFLVGLVVAGALAFSFARAESVHQAQAIAEREMAVRQVEEIRRRAGQRRGEAEHQPGRLQAEKAVGERHSREPSSPDAVSPDGATEPAPAKQPIRVAQREITVQLDEAGKISVDGTACELPQFKEMLAQAVKGREDAVILTVQSDKRCLFEHLAAVLAVCQELDVPHVRIAALGD